MIEKLFASSTLYSTLAMFFDFPQDDLHPRLISRAIGRDVKCVLRQLRLLEECRVIAGRTTGRQRRYRISGRYPLRRELEALFLKTRTCRHYPLQDRGTRSLDALQEEMEPDGTGEG